MAENMQNHNEGIDKNEIYEKSIEQNLWELSDRINQKFWDYDWDNLPFIMIEDEDWNITLNAEIRWEILDYPLNQEQLKKVLEITFFNLSNYMKNENSNNEFYKSKSIIWDIYDINLDDSVINDTTYLNFEKAKEILFWKSELLNTSLNEETNRFIEKYIDFLNRAKQKKEYNFIETDKTYNTREINKNILKFEWKNLTEIKSYINSDNEKRTENSLIFLKYVIKEGYEIKAWDALNLIKNFTPSSMKVDIIDENIWSHKKLNFKLNSDNIEILEWKNIKAIINIQSDHYEILK